jgi:hypothetical protein
MEVTADAPKTPQKPAKRAAGPGRIDPIRKIGT